jgi:hypothetical protein
MEEAMPKVRQVLKHVSVETAQRKRKCHRTSTHAIPKGAICLVIKDEASGGSKNYCTECAEPILKNVEEDLARLRFELGV